ncbi:hypothetical protein AAFF_G00155980 [Aldrovandia affinis]|uniref:Uncharacterized protein n=1 Tax=Aldrovandia affinis TaxID=143900 RepID=A0AAD7RNR2_9TELE|nr:hypothetical protein AAFF_G00155980 [Aldrovandia affinis]
MGSGHKQEPLAHLAAVELKKLGRRELMERHVTKDNEKNLLSSALPGSAQNIRPDPNKKYILKGIRGKLNKV